MYCTQVQYIQPYDESQKQCIISGEAFQQSYIQETDSWYFEDCVELLGEDAKR